MTRHVTTCTWDDVPHLTEKAKADLLASFPPHMRDARSKGIPSIGAGAIYPVSEEAYLEEPIELPVFWPRVYGLDVGWNRTAAIWLAYDRDTDTAHAYAEHYVGQADPAVHAAAIRARGDWMPGVIDPASRGRSQHDGQQLWQRYCDLGLHLTMADNAVEAGLFDVLQRLSTGRLRIFNTLRHTLGELRIYRRDERGRVVKQNDHLMDALRYGVMSGLAVARCRPDAVQVMAPRRDWHPHAGL